MNELIVALGLALVIEGVIYALFPGAMKAFLAKMLAEPESHLRWLGLTAAIIGVGVIWAAHG